MRIHDVSKLAGVLFLLSAFFALRLSAQSEVPVSVEVKIWGTGMTHSVGGDPSDYEIDGSGLPSSPTANDGSFYMHGGVSSGSFGIGPRTARLEPDRVYPVTVQAFCISSVTMYVFAPQGYQVELDGVEQKIVSGTGNAGSSWSYTHTYLLRIKSPQQAVSGRAGAATSMATNKLYWKVSLGALHNGTSAGELAVDDAATSSSWSSLFTTGDLQYQSTSPEVAVYRDTNGNIRQVVANQTAVDVVTNSSTQYDLKFYDPGQLSGSAYPYSFTGLPYVIYRVEQGSTSTTVKVTSYTRNITSLTDTTATVVRTAVTTFARSGSWPNFTWTRDDWNTSGQSQLVEEVHAPPSGGNGTNRIEYLTVKVPGGATALQATDNYTQFAWGEELTSHAVGSTSPMTTTRTYNTNTTNPGTYGYLNSVVAPGGKWTAYDYWDPSSDDARTGMIKYLYRAFNGSPSTVTLDPTQGEVTYFDYAQDPFGAYSRPALIQTSVNNVMTTKSSIAYSNVSGSVNGQTVVQAVRQDYSDSTHYLGTTTEFYIENCPDTFLRNQIQSVTLPSGQKTSLSYLHGTIAGSDHEFSVVSGGTSSCVATIIGTTTSTGNTLCSTYSGYTLDSLYLVDGKSTLSTTIRDSKALVRRTETYVWSSGAWVLVSFAYFDYDFAGQLLNSTASNGAVRTNTYSGDQLASSTDETGVVVNFSTYDAAGRIQTAAKVSGPSTAMGYDSLNHVTSSTVSASGESVVTAEAYDDAGRLASQTPPGLGTTTTTLTYNYTTTSWSCTAAAPNGGTTIETCQLDGRLNSITGTAVVGQYYTYGVESDGRRWTQVASGSSSSARAQKSWVDWLGRTITAQRPEFAVSGSVSGGGNFVEQNTFDGSTGLLTKTTHTGYAQTLYSYDALGRMTRTGLDVNNDGSLVLASSDRITDRDTVFQLIAGSWWLTTTTTIYPLAGSATSVTAALHRERLTGLATARFAEVHDIDIEGNDVSVTTDVNTGTKTVTLTKSGQCDCSISTETIVNGLHTLTTTKDGLPHTIQYDALGRQSAVIDPRNSNTTTTAYYPNTPLVYTVTDAASPANVMVTNHYDANGRLDWTKDAAGHYTRYAYNLLSQLQYQWGDGSYPVSYGYDGTYGDRTSMSTYRTASAGDFPSGWPSGSVGSPNTTIWTYDAASGLLWKKVDAVGNTVQLDYNLRGQAASRQWARTLSDHITPLKTNYGYDSNTGELTSRTYNDSGETIPTLAVNYSYTRLGQLYQVTDGTGGTRTFNYNSGTPWRLGSESLPSYFGSRLLTENYEGTGSGGSWHGYTTALVAGRPDGFDLGVSGNTARDLHQLQTYSDQARFVGVTAQVGAGSAQDFVYSYISSSALLNGYTAGANFAVSRNYESKRDLATRIQSNWGGTTLTQLDYGYNNLYQRQSAMQSGTAYADYFPPSSYTSVYNYYGYNARGELQSADMFRGTPPGSGAPSSADELPGRHFEYRYDSIGNRVTAGEVGSANSADDAYSTNTLNEYTSKENNVVRVIGTAAANAHVAVFGAPTTAKNDQAWGADLVPPNQSGPVQGTATIYAALPGAGSGGADIINTGTKPYFIPPASQSFAYDADGDLTSDGVWNYTYDAENRLVRMASVLPSGSNFIRWRIDSTYDYLGRRVQKNVVNMDDSSKNYTRRYVYDGWNLVAELDGTGSNLVRSYAWGLDMNGDLARSGGVGALLQMYDYASGKTFYPTFDGNGNVVSLVNAASGALAAVYEYDPFGNYLRAEAGDTTVSDNPFRFSSKFTDIESGLVCFGLRFYSPVLGRFINKDPIEEAGGLNLYGFCLNDSINGYDVLGQFDEDWRPIFNSNGFFDWADKPKPKEDPPPVILEKFVVVANRIYAPSNEEILRELNESLRTNPIQPPNIAPPSGPIDLKLPFPKSTKDSAKKKEKVPTSWLEDLCASEAGRALVAAIASGQYNVFDVPNGAPFGVPADVLGFSDKQDGQNDIFLFTGTISSVYGSFTSGNVRVGPVHVPAYRGTLNNLGESTVIHEVKHRQNPGAAENTIWYQTDLDLPQLYGLPPVFGLPSLSDYTPMVPEGKRLDSSNGADTRDKKTDYTMDTSKVNAMKSASAQYSDWDCSRVGK